MPINFVTTSSKNYSEVQNQILGSIKAHLPKDAYSESRERANNESLNFSLFIHQPADVVMSHGVADKNYFYRKDETGGHISCKLSHVFVPGDWLKRRLVASKKLNLTEDRVHSVGWPRLDDLLRRQANISSPSGDAARKKILWAPTHDYARRGNDQVSLSSYPLFEKHVETLKQHFDVAVSLHPRNRKDKVPTVDKILWADYIISDFGTMVYEAWALGKPVIFPDWLIRENILEYMSAGCAERYIFENGIGAHASSIEELIDLLSDDLKIDQKTSDFLADYLDPKYLGSSSSRVASLLCNISDGFQRSSGMRRWNERGVIQ